MGVGSESSCYLNLILARRISGRAASSLVVLFVAAFPAETTEAFLEGHMPAFAYVGGVPTRILYDNTKIA